MNYKIIIGLATFVATSCSTIEDKKHITIGEVVSVSNMKEVSLSSKRHSVAPIGTVDINILDSLLIMEVQNVDHFYEVVRLPNKEKLGNFLIKGRGPNEFSQPPRLMTKHSGGSLSCRLLYVKTLFRWNILNTDEPLSYPSKINELNTILYSLELGDSSLYVHTLNNQRTGKKRYFLSEKNQQKSTNQALSSLDSITVDPDNINVIASICKSSTEKGRIVEAFPMLNEFVIYDRKGSFCRTILRENDLININKVCDKTKKRTYPIFYRFESWIIMDCNLVIK